MKKISRKSASPSVSRTPVKKAKSPKRKSPAKKAKSPVKRVKSPTASKRASRAKSSTRTRSASASRARSVSPFAMMDPSMYVGNMQALRRDGKRVATKMPCGCMNKDGTPCANLAVDGTQFCTRHTNCSTKGRRSSSPMGGDPMQGWDFERGAHPYYIRGVDHGRAGRGYEYSGLGSLPFEYSQMMDPRYRSQYLAMGPSAYMSFASPLDTLLFRPAVEKKNATTATDTNTV